MSLEIIPLHIQNKFGGRSWEILQKWGGLSTILENWATHPARTHPALLEKKLHRVSHPEEIWGHQFQLGVLRGP